MQVNVLFFGVLSDVVGQDNLIIQNTDNMNDLKNKLISMYPGLKDFTYTTAVNQQMVTGNHQFVDNDTVAMMPPFAGG